jgi:hypothetical protein
MPKQQLRELKERKENLKILILKKVVMASKQIKINSDLEIREDELVHI